MPGPGAEDVLVADEGHAWTDTADGAIIRINPDSLEAERVAMTEGRPLGLECLPDGRLLVDGCLRPSWAETASCGHRL